MGKPPGKVNLEVNLEAKMLVSKEIKEMVSTLLKMVKSILVLSIQAIKDSTNSVKEAKDLARNKKAAVVLDKLKAESHLKDSKEKYISEGIKVLNNREASKMDHIREDPHLTLSSKVASNNGINSIEVSDNRANMVLLLIKAKTKERDIPATLCHAKLMLTALPTSLSLPTLT